jgi:hypothetical protein
MGGGPVNGLTPEQQRRLQQLAEDLAAHLSVTVTEAVDMIVRSAQDPPTSTADIDKESS